MSDESWVRAFSAQLDELRDFPDLAKINNVVHIAKQQERLSQPFTDCVINKLISGETPPTYRKPLFYAIDAIMKHVGGAYGQHFARQLGEKFPMTIRDISDVDRKKIDFMLGTWLERKYFAPELISRMKNRINMAVAATPVVPQISHFNPSVPSVTIQPVAPVPLNPLALLTALAGNTGAGNNINDLVVVEMNNILQQMYSDMNISNALSLDEIAIANPALYADIRTRAEGNIQASLLAMQQAVNVMQPSHSAPMAMNLSNNTNNASRKRPGRFQAEDQGRRPTSSNNSHSRYPAGSNSTSTSQPSSGSRRPPAPPTLTIPNPKPVSAPSSSSSSSTASTKTSQTAQASSQKEVPKNCVNGYVSEAAVVIDVDRVKLVSDNLMNYKHNPSMIPFPDSDKLAQLSSSLIQRLDSYLSGIKVPPVLPSVLNGPLPNEPIFNKVTKSTPSTIPIISGPVKRAMPSFNMDLTRIPDVMLKALYIDRPHQYHEDGLRFRTLAQLTEHTDKSLEKKKLLAKSGKQREYREWYCTIDQWVTDFNALNLKNVPADESKHNAGTSGEAVEEFILPADENFKCCPFTNESFEKFFDKEEGEYMYRNAVKVLVTEQGNPSIFKKGKPAIDEDIEEEIDGLHYLIAHKLLVVDRWIQEGKATSLQDAISRYESMGGYSAELVNKLRRAAGEDDDLEDIFFVLEQM